MFGFHGFCLFVLKAEINIRSGVSQKWQKKQKSISGNTFTFQGTTL